MNRLSHTLVFILTCLVANSQVRPNISEIVKEIAFANILDYAFVGDAAITSKQYYRFINLRDSATHLELMKLIGHDNNVVRGYAGWALIDRKSGNELELFINFTENNGDLEMLEGCLGFESELNYEFYQRVKRRQNNYYVTKNDFEYYSRLRVQLDSFILHSNCCEILLREAIRNNRSNPYRYDAIRKLALKHKNQDALVELASYRKQQDIEPIMKFKKEAFNAIAEFPDLGFWPFINKYSKTERSISYYRAIAAYENQRAEILLKSFLDSNKCSQNGLNQDSKILFRSVLDHDNHSKCEVTDIYQVVAKRRYEGYDNLLLYFFNHFQAIDMLALTGLTQRKKQETAISIKAQLLSSKKLHILNIGYNTAPRDSTIHNIIKLVSEYYPESMDSICAQRIKIQSFTSLTPFLEYTATNKFTELDTIILNRLLNEKRAYETFHLTKTYLRITENESKEPLMSILNSNQEYWNKGNWSKSFEKLFKTYNIN